MSENTIEEKVEVFYYKANMPDDLRYAEVTREKLTQCVKESKDEGLNWVIIEKSLIPSDLLPVLNDLCSQKPPLTSDGIIKRLSDIQRDVESLKDSIEDLLDELQQRHMMLSIITLDKTQSNQYLHNRKAKELFLRGVNYESKTSTQNGNKKAGSGELHQLPAQTLETS